MRNWSLGKGGTTKSGKGKRGHWVQLERESGNESREERNWRRERPWLQWYSTCVDLWLWKGTESSWLDSWYLSRIGQFSRNFFDINTFCLPKISHTSDTTILNLERVPHVFYTLSRDFQSCARQQRPKVWLGQAARHHVATILGNNHMIVLAQGTAPPGAAATCKPQARMWWQNRMFCNGTATSPLTGKDVVRWKGVAARSRTRVLLLWVCLPIGEDWPPRKAVNSPPHQLGNSDEHLISNGNGEHCPSW